MTHSYIFDVNNKNLFSALQERPKMSDYVIIFLNGMVNTFFCSGILYFRKTI